MKRFLLDTGPAQQFINNRHGVRVGAAACLQAVKGTQFLRQAKFAGLFGAILELEKVPGTVIVLPA